MPWAYLGWVSYVPEPWRRRLLGQLRTTGPARTTRACGSPTSGARTLDRLLALNLETYLLDDLLVKIDRTSMAHGLEVRSPFLDTALVEFALRLAAVSQGPWALAQAGAEEARSRICFRPTS